MYVTAPLVIAAAGRFGRVGRLLASPQKNNNCSKDYDSCFFLLGA